ncbi:MAG: beta strand repeat-containing protein, partial [Flavobacteriales bacterium]
TTHNYHNINFTATSGTVQFQHHYSNSNDKVLGNYNQVTFGAGANITGDWTVGTLIMTSNNTYSLQAGRTATVTNNISFGAVCFGGVTLQSATVGTQAIITKTSGTVNGQNLTIKDINATGGATYNAYGSTNMGNNTGWNFLTTQTLGSLGQISTTQNGFSVSPIAGAVSYTWTLPAGSNFLSGQGTTNISSSNVNGQVCVTASNGCGSTTAASCINTGIVSIDLGGVNNTNVCQGSTSVNRTYVGTNGSPNVYSIDFDATANAAGIADVVNANISASPLIFSIPNNVAPGVYNGVLTVTNTTTAISSINYNITVSVVGNPTMAITANPSVCQGTTVSSLVFSGTTNSPNQYSIDYDPTANAASFTDVVNQSLTGSPIPISIPAGASPATYNANLTIVNTSTGCQGIYPITIAVNAIPTATFGGNPSVVVGTTTSSIALTNTVGSPNQYSINYDATANGAGFNDLTNQSLAGNAIPITIPAGAAAGTYNATITLTNTSTNCSSTSVAVTVTLNASAPPTITLGTSPSICTGTTLANLTYSNATNNPNEYTIDFDATANSAGLNDVAWVSLTASPIGITVPGNIAAGTYNGTI